MNIAISSGENKVMIQDNWTCRCNFLTIYFRQLMEGSRYNQLGDLWILWDLPCTVGAINKTMSWTTKPHFWASEMKLYLLLKRLFVGRWCIGLDISVGVLDISHPQWAHCITDWITNHGFHIKRFKDCYQPLLHKKTRKRLAH